MQTRHTANPEDMLSIGDAARLAGVSVETFRRWANSGHVPVQQVVPGGHRRFRRGDVEALLRPSEPAEVAS